MNNKDDDLNDDFDIASDNDLDSDFGEFDQKTERGSLGELVRNNPAIKIGLVAAALLVVIGAITLFGGSSEAPPASNVAAGNDVRDTPGSQELSPQMQQAIEELNEQQREQALREGGSVIPQPVDTLKERLPVAAEETPAEDPLARWRAMQEERLQTQQTQQAQVQQQQPVADPARDAALQSLMTGISAQMSQIISAKRIDSLKSMQVTNIQDLIAAQQAAAQGNLSAGQIQQLNAAGGYGADMYGYNQNIDPMTGQPYPPAKILLPAGAIEYAQLLIEANSDVEGPIVSMIVSGPFAGARVLGNFQRKEKYLVMQFSTLVDKKGTSIPIQAYALDPDTTLTGMATEVDNRYWQRIILPAAADFVEGLGEAYADRQGNTTIVTGDVVVQDEEPIDVEEQVAAGVEKAAERVGDILEEEGDNTEPLVRVAAGTPMGILFLTAVTDQDFKAGLNNPMTARTMQQQQQQQQQLLLQQQLQGNQAQNPLYLIQSLQGLQAGNAPTQPGANPIPVTGTSTATGGSNNNGLPRNIFSTQDYLNNQNR